MFEVLVKQKLTKYWYQARYHGPTYAAVNTLRQSYRRVDFNKNVTDLKEYPPCYTQIFQCAVPLHPPTNGFVAFEPMG